MTAINRYEIKHQLFAKAFSDRAFLLYLQGSPQAALESFLGAPLPPGTKVQVLVEDSQTLYALLPHPSHSFLGNLDAPTMSTNDTREQIECALNARMATDPQFAQQFRADPTGTVRALAPLVAGVIVQLAEEPADTVYIIIPYYGRSTYRI